MKEESQEQSMLSSAKVEDWIGMFESSKKYMKDNFLPKYKLARDRLQCRYMVESAGRGYKTHKQVNLTYSIGSTFVNSTYFKSPDINFTARDDQEMQKVEQTEVKVNEIIKDKKVKKTVKRMVWDAYLGGFGACFVDYEYSDVDDPSQPLPDGGFARIVLKNKFVIKRIRPELLRFPSGFDFDCFQDSPWLGFELLVPVTDLPSYKQFDPEVVALIKGKKYEDFLEENKRKEFKNDIPYASLLYCFLKPENENEPVKFFVLSDEVKDRPLQPMTEFDKGQTGYPIKFVYFNPLDDECSYPVGDPWLFESQLWAVDKWWLAYGNHIRRNSPKTLVDKKKLNNPAELIKKLKNNEDMEIVDIETKGGEPASNVVSPFQHPNIPPEVTQFYQTARQVMDEVGPRSAQARGVEAGKDQTATEASIIQSNELLDSEARADDIAELFKDIAIDLAGMLTRYNGEVSVQGKSSMGNTISQKVTSDGFTNKVNADVDVLSMQHPNREVFRKQMLELLAQVGIINQELAKDGKRMKSEFIVTKFVENIGIKGSESAIVPINVKNPNREHEDLIAGAVPQVQDGEDMEMHLLEHYNLMNDQNKMAVYTKANPQFGEILNAHIIDTSQKLAQKKQQKSGKPRSPTQAGELSRSMRA